MGVNPLSGRSVALGLVPDHKAKRVDFKILHNPLAKDVGEGTVKRGSATCPVCGFTTPVKSVREQLKKRRGGAADARLFCVVTTRPGQQGRFYRHPTERDADAVKKAAEELERRKKAHKGTISLVPEEEISLNEIRRISAPIYGMMRWGDLFSPRQLLTLSTLCRLVGEAGQRVAAEHADGLADAVQTCLAFGISRLEDRSSSLCRWDPTPTASGVINTFSRQALPMMWDYAEGVPLEEKSGGWLPSLEWIALVVEREGENHASGSHTHLSSATQHPLPDSAVNAFITDPPYYDAVPYAYLSDFFYVWLRRNLGTIHPSLLRDEQVPKDPEIVVDRPHELSKSKKDVAFYERELTRAFFEGCRVLRPDGIGLIVFASKTTASWEAILQAVVDAGWTITGSWPIDTEMGSRVAAQGQARLASSVHLVCRPRQGVDTPRSPDGDWRDVLAELPKRMHEWMPRLASEGVVGADAIFACLGPALEIFSRHARVEKASGEKVELREYLEHVWAAVATEALSMIFKDADAAGLEPDARLTTMWLWTLGSGTRPGNGNGGAEEDESAGEEEGEAKPAASGGFALEFDAALKIARGLGVHLEKCESIVAVKGDTARLLGVAERTRHLFGKDADRDPAAGKKAKKKPQQQSLFEMLDEGAGGEGRVDLKAPPPGTTVLDRLHQAMILFGAGRGELLKRFLLENSVGKDARLWKLAQSLSALYPAGSDEKRWVDGVLARKKGLGL